MGDELEGKEHGGAEDVERPPVHVARYGERAVGKEVWTCLTDKSDELTGRVDSNVQRSMDGGVWPMQREANVMICGADDDTLDTEPTNRGNRAAKRARYSVIIQVQLGREIVKPFSQLAIVFLYR